MAGVQVFSAKITVLAAVSVRPIAQAVIDNNAHQI